ncbi:MAG: Mrp/NBP35 family ATP-binding protein [Actinomycetota bacterium]|nr:Mrp/NBP35 family ATP-binding protein [Actinomycetota bacterium]
MGEGKINDEVARNMSGVKNKFMVFSGKGGVGKTTVSVNLAYRIKTKGYKVAILDVDIHGPNVIKIMGLEKQRLSGKDDRIESITAFGDMKVVSTASILEKEDSPVIWRGPLKMKLIRQFLSDVNWGDIDYMIIDSPPGTGDEPLSIAQLITDLDGGIVVTTPQSMATMDARKSIRFAQQLKIPFIGVIENMSGFICPHCGQRIDIFKTGGGQHVAEEMDVEFLGRIPYDNKVMSMSDEGNVYLKNYKNGTPVSEAFSHIADKIIKLPPA